MPVGLEEMRKGKNKEKENGMTVGGTERLWMTERTVLEWVGFIVFCSPRKSRAFRANAANFESVKMTAPFGA
jgi:hypothetical protein